MINLSKLLRTNDSTKQRIIVFNYTDGLYKWIVSDDYTIGVGGRSDRGLNEFSEMAYIDINELSKVA